MHIVCRYAKQLMQIAAMVLPPSARACLSYQATNIRITLIA